MRKSGLRVMFKIYRYYFFMEYSGSAYFLTLPPVKRRNIIVAYFLSK